ncbi:MAG: succinylglutamate desuccinylase [Candidatus Pelagadaptatus aseana]|uniref:succinylglutamate desuccinylase n=1 Tax=Candidatus Pelagadaptatus aseana TaxID=3120508 RepID=UPI0039B261BB
MNNTDRRITAQALNQQLLEQGFLAITREHPGGISLQNRIQLDNCSLQLIDTGILLVEPHPHQSTGMRDIVISSGIHGNETAPIEIVDRIAAKIIAGAITVRNRTLLIIGNPVAMNLGKRFDEENMNRLFNGKHRGKTHHEALRAKKLEKCVASFYAKRQAERIHYDLHTAIRGSLHPKFAIYPYPDGRYWNKNQIAFMADSGIDAILLSHQPSSTFSYFSSAKLTAQAFTVELGKVRPFGENKCEDFAAMENNLIRLISNQAVPALDQPADKQQSLLNKVSIFEVTRELIKQSESFRLNISKQEKNFTPYPKGFQITEDHPQGHIIENDGDAIVFPNDNIPVGQRAGLIVSRTTI